MRATAQLGISRPWQPALAIPPLAAAIAAIRPSVDHLTPQHAMLMQCCLLSKCYNAALPTLESPIFEAWPVALVPVFQLGGGINLSPALSGDNFRVLIT